MSALGRLIDSLRLQADVFHNGQYCGAWSVDTSGSNLMSFHVVTHGRCVLAVQDKDHQLNAGDAVFFPNDASHRLQDQASTQASAKAKLNTAQSIPFGLGVQSDGTGLVCGSFKHANPYFNFLRAQLPSVIIVKKQSPTSVTDLLDLILNESKNAEDGETFVLNRLSETLLYCLLRDNLSVESGILAACSHPKLSIAMTAIHDSDTSRLSVEELAAHCAMSRSAFAGLFKQVSGISPAEYATQWRLNQAYNWLQLEGISIIDAALRAGYESEASFSKAFKRVIGVSPGSVRRLFKTSAS